MRDGLSGWVSVATGSADRTFRVDLDQSSVKIEVPRGIPVRRDGRAISVHELRQGDFVRVRGDWRGRDRIRAASIDATSEARTSERGAPRDDLNPIYGDRSRASLIVGTVTRINERDETLVLRTPSGEMFNVDAGGADVRIDGRRRDLSALRSDDEVRVTANRDRGRR